MSAKVRWAAWVAAAAAIGVGLAVFLERYEPLQERVLAYAPRDAAIVAYAELAPLRRSDKLGRIVRRRLLDIGGLSVVEPDLDAIAVTVGSDEIAGLAAGRFPVSLIRRYLEQKGAQCGGGLEESACALAAGERGGYLSIKSLQAGLIGVTAGPRADGADRLVRPDAGAALAGPARAALDAGSLVWIWIEPRRLTETMSHPPEGWINLSLVARALLSARDAALHLRDHEERDAVDATLEARCASQADAAELTKMLESLNKLGATALRSGGSPTSHSWAQALDGGFAVSSAGDSVTARWLLPLSLLEDAGGKTP